MKKFLLPVLSLLSGIVMTSCNEKVDLLVSNDQTMGTVLASEKAIITDQGVRYDIFSKDCDDGIYDLHRVFISSDILREGKEPSSYDIHLRHYEPVGLPPYDSEQKRPAEGVQTDPVMINVMWVSGHYLNFRLVYAVPKGSDEGEHDFSFITYREKEDDFFLIDILHDAHGEVYGATLDDKREWTVKTCFVSLPLESFYEAGSMSGTVTYEVHYTWYVTENGKLTGRTQPNYLRGSFRAY